jgi:hypothetical protein
MPSELGEPASGTTDYSLCIYDESGGTPSRVASLTVPPGGTCRGKPCWRARKNGLIYKDAAGTAAGVTRIGLRAGATGKTKASLKARGPNVPAMADFAQDPRVLVQMSNGSGTCWETTHAAPAGRNDSTRFKDRAD